MATSIDIPAAVASLDVGEERDLPELGWLSASWEEPVAFWKALAAHVQRAGGPLKSRSGKVYDLYSDAVGRYAAGRQVAYLGYDRLAGWQSLSYAEIDARAGSLAGNWAALGVTAGAVVALVLEPGADAIVALAAALRLGACFSWLPPLGDLALAARLKAARPAHVVFDPRRPPKGIGELAKKGLPLHPGARLPPLPPYGYGEGEPCASLFSWTHGPPDKPVLVPAEVAYLRPLRDGVLAFRLGPGDHLAAPGVHPGQHLPALWLTTMLAGATFVDVPLAEVVKSPALLNEQPIHSLGVTAALAKALQANPIGRPAALRGLWRPVDEPLDWPVTRDFVAKNGLKDIPFGNVLVDSAAGGCVLFSARRPGSPSAKALPSAAVPWKLFTPGTAEPSLGDSGVFVALGAKKPEPKEEGWLILARVGTEYLYGSAVRPRRAGRVFPAAELAEAVATLPFVEGASVVALAGAGPAGGSLFVLCVFVGARKVEPALSEQVRGLIDERLGPDFEPDAVELFPLFPRMAEKKVDADWCAAQYVGGRLQRKVAEPALGALVELRAALLVEPRAALV